jgi:hypothetical protein
MKRIGFVLFVFVLACAHRCHAYDDGDFQVWHTEGQETKINKDLKLTLEEEFRFADNANEFFYHHYDAGLVYALNKHLDIGLNFRRVYERVRGKFRVENRPHINITPKWELFGMKFEDRSRFQYRNFDYQEEYWQYRNKFTVKFPWKFTRLEIQPYLADEIFVTLNDGEVNRNRYYAGLGMKLTKNLKAEFYYLLQRGKSSGKWSNSNVFGSKLKVIF